MSERREYSRNADQDEVLKLLSPFKVLVIDHNAEFLTYVACLLNSCSFDVTCVDHSGAALKMLSEKKENEFDLLLIDNDIIDEDVHALLRSTKIMDLLSIVTMAEDGDDTLVLEALRSGAFLVLKKPLTIGVVKHIRQSIIKERINKNDKRQNKSMIRNACTLEESTTDNRNSESKRKDIDEPMKNAVEPYHDNNLVYKSAEDDVVDDSIKKKTCMDGTQELHEKFLDAIRQLGEGSIDSP